MVTKPRTVDSEDGSRVGSTDTVTVFGVVPAVAERMIHGWFLEPVHLRTAPELLIRTWCVSTAQDGVPGW
jgi:hypothetical protein